MNRRLFAALALLASPAFAGPRVAIVLDDFGLTYKKNVPDEEWMAFDQPLTLEAGKELIVHYPFDPFQKLVLAKDAAAPEDVVSAGKLLEKSLRDIPGAVGLNNHRSYRATRNRPLMREFMKLLKAKDIYFLDSKVSPRTVAYEEAQAAGVRAVMNYVFLDTAEIHTQAFCARNLAIVVAHARKHGEAVAVGHHYFRGTLDCLKEGMPRYAKEGIEFVKASALAR